MYRVRYRKDSHAWLFIPGCFGTAELADAAIQRHHSGALITRYQVVMIAWYAGR